MITFSAELEKKGFKSIILGNGFGMSYDVATGEKYFNWNTLLDLCDIDEGSKIHQLLTENSFDFELVHQKMNNAIDVINMYSGDSKLIQELEQQIQFLREQLIIAVSRSHPSSFTIELGEVENKKRQQRVRQCRKFLFNFERVFSLNYDLLLYWVRCFENDFLGKDSFDKIDGKLVFSPDNNANFLFPHGSLFTYRDGIGALKCQSSKAKPILARLESNINDGHFPMCISEGTGKQKLEAIKSNHYLNFSYNKIKESKGTLFTFGCSFLDSKDDHIIRAMLESPADKIVVGEYRPSKRNYHRLELAFASLQEEMETKKEIVIADTDGTCIW
ncbi:DUF4917 family protein [Psychrobacter sp. Cmf 22.2]|uniref:DUF4917 family protein n=1 Tax=Psychrobacter sp. Cmf 22.2 TaxID=1926478 RepID=UPI000946CBC2|nr:DUF4917 family protein [Psychrobacter sp. Cmf 22.2]OLF36810.1 hypothetical protein BTV98_10435 [Psychrobacter sp. Cmf 22.2]